LGGIENNEYKNIENMFILNVKLCLFGFFEMDIFGINTSSPRKSQVTSGIAMLKKIYS
jgi:hypothetical protein